MDATRYFEGKKITLMGLGLLGRGVGDVRFLARSGADLIVTDLKTREQLAASLALLAEFPNIRYTLGEHKLEDFRDRDLIIKGPKTPVDSPYIEEAEKNGIPVTMSTALFARFARESGAALIGITGTRGKTTTTEMIAHILKAGGNDVIVGGNIRGVSTLALLPDVSVGTVCVLELDSWQLQGFRAEELSPHIAVFTNLYPDHQDYYEDMDDYLADKAEIFLHQGPDDTLVLGPDADAVIKEPYRSAIASTVVVADPDTLPADALSIPGAHNRANAACALAAVEAFGTLRERALAALSSFNGVPGRLELVREKNGVKYYNDNNSTTPEATIAGLRALGSEKERRLVLIMGGDEKHLDMAKLVQEIPIWCKAVVLFKERGTDRIRDEVFALTSGGVNVSEEEGLKATVERAISYAKEGDTVLFSPAFSSFGKYYKNEYDRSDQFVALIRAL